MGTNKRILKHYVRYDGSGRIIPGGNILSRLKPKVGNWTEIPAEMCHGMMVYVCGAGSTVVNGAYVYAGSKNGKSYYEKGIYRISWGEYPGYEDWEITDGTTWFYYSAETVTTPNAVNEWATDDGTNPAPSVILCACPSTPSPAPSNICVAGLSDSNWNGTYANIGTAEGRPRYQKDGNRDVYWSGTQWRIGDAAYSNDDVADPTLVTTWSEGGITVIDGTCDFPAECYTVTLTCTQERSSATFGVYYCYEEPSALTVVYGVPQTVCCSAYPVLLEGVGTMELGESCTTTTTTTIAPTTTTTTTIEPTTTTTTTAG